MRVILIMLLISPILIGLGGCSNQKGTPPSSKGVSYKIIKLKDLNDKQILLPDLDTSVDLLKKERGIFSFTHDQDLIIFIGIGQKSTAGFDVEVESINTENNGTTYDIKVKEISPKPGSMVAQVITYPYVLINLGKVPDVKEIRVIDERGTRFDTLHYFSNPPRIEKN